MVDMAEAAAVAVAVVMAKEVFLRQSKIKERHNKIHRRIDSTSAAIM